MAGLKSRTFECPECAGQFTLLLTDEDPLPEFCPLPGCGQYVGANPEPIPNFSRVRNAKNQTMDNVYRGMEESSYARAQAAADLAGCDVSEMSALKITNMRDNLREGDVSYMAPTTASNVTKIHSPPPPVAPMGGQVGLATSQLIRQTGGAVGHGVMDKLKAGHQGRANAMQRAGQMGSHSGNT